MGYLCAEVYIPIYVEFDVFIIGSTTNSYSAPYVTKTGPGVRNISSTFLSSVKTKSPCSFTIQGLYKLHRKNAYSKQQINRWLVSCIISINIYASRLMLH